MRPNLKTLIAVACIVAAGFANLNAQDHEHELKAPNGGRLVKNIEPHAEIFVADDGLVKVTFLEDDGAVIKPGAQIVTLVGGNRMDPIRLNFEKDGDSFVSEAKLPMGSSIPLVVQIQEELGGNTYRERFQLNMSSCPTCEYKEYACACHADEEEADDHGHGHSHGEGGHSHSH